MRAVGSSEVHLYWARIKPEIDRLLRFGSDGYVTEDVFVFLRNGVATLYVNDGEWAGFAILQLLPNYYGKRLHCWIVQTTSDPKEYMDKLIAIAKSHGADRITFESPRKGWARRAERLGFTAARVVYERILT
jgi:GNAT superfamily N-acetyltransferase